MSDPHQAPAQPGNIELKIPLAIGIPIISLAVIAVSTIGFAWLLLSLPKEVAPLLALVISANILGACAYLSFRRRMPAVSAVELLIVITYPLLIGFALVQLGIFEGEATEHGGAAAAHSEGAAASGTTSSIVATGIQWDIDEINLPAGEEATMEIDNQDPSVHNLAIYEDEAAASGGEALYTSPDVPGSTSKEVTIDPLDKGEYYFHCDYHPSMKGTVKVG